MDGHPPLCPKVKDSFLDTPCGLIATWPVAWGHLHEANENHRRYIARYQACAWMDRADRWWKVFMRRYAQHRNVLTIHGASGECHDVARAWRAWERGAKWSV